MPKRILLTGGPSSGKTTLLNHLQLLRYSCFAEVSRELIKNAQKEGVDQLFLENPLLFSSLLKEARIAQFCESARLESDYVFYDRGIPDTVAYLDFIGQPYPKEFAAACLEHIYDQVFVLPPWREIHTKDGERYESFEQAQEIYKELLNTYKTYQYKPIEVPRDTTENRAQFIIKKLIG